MTDPLTSLVERLEKAAAGSRELSDEMLEACGWHHCVDKRLPDRSQWGWLAPGTPPKLIMSDPCPTTSIDAALTLVPEGYEWWRVPAYHIENRIVTRVTLRQFPTYPDLTPEHLGTATTTSLAICIAALRARQQGEG